MKTSAGGGLKRYRLMNRFLSGLLGNLFQGDPFSSDLLALPDSRMNTLRSRHAICPISAILGAFPRVHSELLFRHAASITPILEKGPFLGVS